jgi:hypothetical protein
LMWKDKLGKVECKFCNNVISYRKDRILFQLGYRYDGNGRARIVMCWKAHPRVKALFIRCGGVVPPPLNNMEVSTHIPNQQTEDMTMETLNPLVEGKYISTFQMEGAQNFIPLINNTKGPTKVVKTNMTCQFCIGHHINIHPNASITSIKTDARKSFVTLGLPPLQLVTKNRFQLLILQQPNFFKCLMHPPPPPNCTCSNSPKSRHVHVINGFHGSGSPN